MRIAFIICACMLLSACGTPVSSAANMALSSVTYFFTGKTTTDHGLSLMFQEDCEILRALEGEICRPVGNGYPRANLKIALQPLQTGSELAEAQFLRADGSAVVDPDRPVLAKTPLTRDIETRDITERVSDRRRDPRAQQVVSRLTSLGPADDRWDVGGRDDPNWDRRFGFYHDR